MVELRWTSVTVAPLACRSCAMSCPLLPEPMMMARLPRHASPSWYWLEWRTVPAKLPSVGMSGRIGMPLTPVGATKLDRPTSLRLVVAAAGELGAGPAVELHAVHIGFEPRGELVLRDIGRPVRRKRHVGQVVDVHLVVQDQRVITVAPVVADALLAIDDQRVD